MREGPVDKERRPEADPLSVYFPSIGDDLERVLALRLDEPVVDAPVVDADARVLYRFCLLYTSPSPRD